MVQVPGAGRLRPAVWTGARLETERGGGAAEDWLCRLVVRQAGQTSLQPGLGSYYVSPANRRDVEIGQTWPDLARPS